MNRDNRGARRAQSLVNLALALLALALSLGASVLGADRDGLYAPVPAPSGPVKTGA